MCGQFAIFAGLKSVIEYYNFLKDADFNMDDNIFLNDENDLLNFFQNNDKFYTQNIIKPMNYFPIIAIINNQVRFFPAKWGLIPFWVKDKKKSELNNMLFSYDNQTYNEKPRLSDFIDTNFAYKTINARIETIKEKPSFKYAYKQRRCLIPFKCFYEKSSANDKYIFSNPDDCFKSFAGLYEIWKNDIISLTTFTIITTQANKYVSNIHDRMPVILNNEKAIKWISYYKDLNYFKNGEETLFMSKIS
ncbi:MAG: SOS response-associated peptidase [Candidatus Cloacimonetes bacterium]|nr:SOS response-associated peptidase [Candidatus Cloacimonadota bacterium]